MRDDGVPLLHEQAHNAAWHGGLESDGAIGPAAPASGAQGAGIVDSIWDSFRAEVESGLVVLHVENDAMGLARDEQGENARPEKVGIGFYLVTVDLNAPLPWLIGGLDFDLPGLAVDFETEASWA